MLAAPHGGERGKSFGPSLQVSPPLKVLRKAFSNDLTTYVPRTAAHVTASSHTPESLNLHVTIRAGSCTMYAAVCSCFLGGGGVSAGDYKSISSIPPPPPSSQRPLKKSWRGKEVCEVAFRGRSGKLFLRKWIRGGFLFSLSPNWTAAHGLRNEEGKSPQFSSIGVVHSPRKKQTFNQCENGMNVMYFFCSISRFPPEKAFCP